MPSKHKFARFYFSAKRKAIGAHPKTATNRAKNIGPLNSSLDALHEQIRTLEKQPIYS
jgi:hypothetical protein